MLASSQALPTKKKDKGDWGGGGSLEDFDYVLDMVGCGLTTPKKFNAEISSTYTFESKSCPAGDCSSECLGK